MSDEEVKGPIYAYRVYRTEYRGLGNARVLVPLYFRHVNTHDQPVANSGVTSFYQKESEEELNPVHVDLFDWFTSPTIPALESPHHVWVTRDHASPFDVEGVEEWWPQATETSYMAYVDDMKGKRLDETRAEGRGVYYNGLRTGIHSYKKLHHACVYAHQLRGSWQGTSPTTPPIIAKIEIGGVVVEHEDGYRSEKSRIVELMMFAQEQARQSMAASLGWPFEITVPEENDD